MLKPSAAKPIGLTEYEVRHLATHLVLAARYTDLHDLLGSESPEGHNLWFNVKEEFGDIEGFSADVRLAWARAEEGFLSADQHQKAEALALQIRYSLTISSVRSLVQNLASNLIRELVVEGIWRAEQALAYARQVADPYRRLSMLSLIIPLLSEPLRISVLKEALKDVDSVQGLYYRADALTELAPHLPPDLLEEAYQYSHTETLESSLDDALTGLAPYLPEALLPVVLKEVETMSSEDSRIRVWIALAPRLQSSVRDTVLHNVCAAIPKITKAYSRTLYLVKVAPLVSKPSESRSLFIKAMAELRSLPRNLSGHPVRIIQEMLPHLPDDLIPEALEMARNLYLPNNRVEALISMLPRLSQKFAKEVFRDALEEVRKREHSYDRAKLLINLAETAPEALKDELLQEAKAAILKIDDNENSSWLTTLLARQFDSVTRQQMLRAALQKARLINDETELAMTRFALGRSLLPESLPLWLDRLRAGGSGGLLLALLSEMVQHLDERQLQEVLTMVRENHFGRQAAAALRLLMPHLTPPLRKKTIAIAISNIEDVSERAKLLTDLLPYLERNLKRNVIDTVMPLVTEMYYDRDRILDHLYPHMTSDHLLTILKETSEKEYPEGRVNKLASLIEYLPEPTQPTTALMVLKDMCELDPMSQARLLVKIGRYLPPSLLEEILVKPPLNDTYYRDESLVELIPHLPDSLIKKLVAESLKVRNRRYRFWFLADIYPQVGGEYLDKKIKKALDKRYHYIPERILTLSEFSMHVSQNLIRGLRSWSQKVSVTIAKMLVRSQLAAYALEPSRTKVLLTAVEESRELRDASLRVYCLATLAPCFDNLYKTELYDEASRELLAITDGDKFAASLNDVAPNLATELLPALIEKTLTLGQSLWVDCLSLLIPLASQDQQLKIAYALQDFTFARNESFSSFGDYYSAAAAQVVPRLTDENYELALADAKGHPVLERAERLAGLLRPGEHFPDEIIYPHFSELLHLRSEQDRLNLLRDLHSQGHLVAKLGGAGAIASTFEWIDKVGKWWP